MIEAAILEAIKGSPASQPVELWELAEAIDAALRLIPEADVVEAALRRLAAHGRVRELPEHRYVDGENVEGSLVIGPIQANEWTAALARYRGWSDDVMREMDGPRGIDGPARYPSVVLTMAIGPEGPAAAADLVARLQQAIADRLMDEDLIAICPDLAIDGGSVVGTVATTHRNDEGRFVTIVKGAIEHPRPAGLSVRYADWEM